MNGKGMYEMYVGKWGGVVTAKKVTSPVGYAALMRNAKVNYVCTDSYGWDLYEHRETGELFVTNLSWDDCPDYWCRFLNRKTVCARKIQRFEQRYFP